MVHKVWKQLNREGIAVGRRTVEWLMRRQGLRGVIRGKVLRTTIGNAATCPLDRVNRQFKVTGRQRSHHDRGHHEARPIDEREASSNGD